ncbi:hypothetical protein P8891_06045 [Bacillus atrophaeus]|uniref:hypothetical protein n=2 Tax=Bacillus atrophaeus TaxID=1452 RepID=UPI00228127D6|nr:hypothetical protein [Bacillus atrophaeus]MCY7948679.1 hypothetical protein [Bacillus atrophaeus]MCY9169919.1 hypothetical protein [Bacillus atrophaeus]MEC0740644.1 hypothetical protein [Bacillus atrophaeus]MEC0915915.1 hypothetical protein [Bacillus atrophaeus]
MMGKPIWSVSGKFCGMVFDGDVYDERGNHVGYVRDKVVFSSDTGRAVGEFYDDERVGLRKSRSYSSGSLKVSKVSKSFVSYANKIPLASGGWKDPEF